MWKITCFNKREWASKNKNFLIVTILLTGFSLTIASCDTKESLGLQESLDTVPELSLIEGGESSTVTVNNGTQSYFTLDISNISPNNHIAEGKGNGWCILWNKPIESDNSTHAGLRLYSSYGDKQWKPLNYLLNVRESLMRNNDISYKEIQVAIWTLMDFPEFNLNNISIDQLPSRMVQNGQYNFDRQKVNQIVKHVKENYESFDYSTASAYAVVAETPSDTQTIIIEVSETVWAYGQHSFRNQELRDQLGINGQGKGQWGWIVELDKEFSITATELIAGGGNDDGTMPAEDVGTPIGTLDIAKSGNSMDITYSPYRNYLVNDLHMWVGCSLEDFPGVENSGIVNPGNLTYSYNDEPVSSHSFSVDLADYNCTGNIFLAAYAGKLYQKTGEDLPGPDAEPVFAITDLDSEYGFTVAWDVNDHGHIVGANSYWNSDTQSMTDMGGIFARAMNNNGQVVGDWSQQPVKWDSDGGVLVLDMQGADQGEANDINKNGQVVGELMDEEFLYEDCYLIDDDEYCEDIYDYKSVSFVWTEEEGTNRIGDEGSANGNNDNDIVTGVDFTIQNQAYIWDEQSGIRSLGSYTGFSSGSPYAINNKGQVTGSVLVSQETNLLASKAGYRHQNDNIEKLLRLTSTKGMYDAGHVAEMVRNSTFETEAFPWTDHSERGVRLMQKSAFSEDQQEIFDLVQNTNFSSEPFIWDDNGMISLGTLGGDWSTAWDINDHGQVVGYGDVGNGQHRAFFWDPEFGMIELPTFGGNSLARAINNEGQIVGYSYDDQGNFKPAMWTLSYE